MDIMKLLNDFCVPVCAMIVMAYFIKYIFDILVKQMSEVIKNNTEALENIKILCEKIDDMDDKIDIVNEKVEQLLIKSVDN